MFRGSMFCLLLTVVITASAVSGANRPAAQKNQPNQKQAPTDPFAAIAQSHIEGNTPPDKQFDACLKRDLLAYFKKTTPGVTRVEYQLLRNGPTQSGVSYPKYYVWVSAFKGKRLSVEGAVRVAAVDREFFDVTHYVPKAVIQKDPPKLDAIFPGPVIEKIKEHVK